MVCLGRALRVLLKPDRSPAMNGAVLRMTLDIISSLPYYRGRV